MTSRMASLALIIFCLVSCGKEDKQTKASVGVAASTGASGDQTAATACAGATTLALVDGGELRHVPAESLRIVQGGQVRTMCDAAKDKPHSLTIYQFTSVTCVPCMQWAQKLNADLKAKGFADSVLSVMVLTDVSGLLTADDERRLKKDVAPDASWVYDDFQDLWRFFSPGDTRVEVPAVTPLYVAMDGNQRGFASDDASGDAAALIAKVNTVMGLEIKAKTTAP